MLRAEDTCFVLVDVQGKLASLMAGREELYANLGMLVRGMQILEVPIIWMEQIPDKMGPTIPEVADLLDGQTPIAKACFSCCGNETFRDALAATGRRGCILAGIEAHVCVYQTAMDLLRDGVEVEVVGNAVSSRTAANRDLALERLRAAGVPITSVEMVLFQLMQTAEHPRFRHILKLVK